MTQWIDPADSRYRLGVVVMDEIHREFIDLVNGLCASGNAHFMLGFTRLMRHTRGHFDAEETLMRMSGFPAHREHEAEHRRVLGELSGMARLVADGSLAMARTYVAEHLPDWFSRHAETMDRALAAHIRTIE